MRSTAHQASKSRGGAIFAMTQLSDTRTLLQADGKQATDNVLPNLQSISNRPAGTLRARFEASKAAVPDLANPPIPYGAADVGISEHHSDAAPDASASQISNLSESSDRTQPQTTGASPQQLPPQSASEAMRDTPLPDPNEVAVAQESQHLIAELRNRLNEQASQLQHAETVQHKLQGALEAAGACQERVQVQLREAQQQAAEAAAEASQQERKAALLSAECDGLKRIVASHKGDTTRAQAASGTAEQPVSHGDFDHATTRVVHMVHNPESLARREAEEARFAMLQAENTALRTQLARLEATSAPAMAPAADSHSQGSQPATPAADGAMSLALAQAEVAVLNRKVRAVEKREQRLKQVFKAQIDNLREACYVLFGYRMDLTSEATAAAGTGIIPTTFRLTPQHGDAGAQLLFKLTADGQMVLVHNSYTQQRLKAETATFLGRFKCIAAFTANLTMDNFNKQTQC